MPRPKKKTPAEWEEMHAKSQAAREKTRDVDKLLLDFDATSDRKTFMARRLRDMPVTSRKTYLAACGGKSPTAAIRATCQDCMCHSRASVRSCPCMGCPLWPYRPYQVSDSDGDDENE